MFNFKKNKPKVKGAPEAEFTSWRKRLLRLSLESIVSTLAGLAIVGTKLFYPFHFIIGVGVYLFSFIPLFRRIYTSRKVWQKYHSYKFTEQFFIKERRRLALAFVFILFSIGFLWVRPLDAKPFAGLSHEQIVAQINDDVYASISAMDYLETTGNDLLIKLDTDSEDINTSEEISKAFEEFLRAVAFSESLTETHRYFASIPYSLWRERVSSFLISYSLYVKKYEIVHRLMVEVSGSEFKKKVLNQHASELGRSNVYNEMAVRFYQPKTALRLNGGFVYLQLFAKPGGERGDSFKVLHSKALGSYKYLAVNLDKTIIGTPEAIADVAENKMFQAWFPIQKNVADSMGRAILTTRGKDGFINPEQAIEMGQVMQPGDIMLQRRNWHLSNVGIPGFWTHSAIYTGNLAAMNEYFASEFPFDGHNTFAEYVQAKYPKVYELYNTNDKDGYPRAVIEAIAPGVVLQSLPTSADADFVVALRPRLLNKRDKMLALFKAFSHQGKPYDYNFDFDTRDALVCSELVFDANFAKLPEKRGLSFTTSVVNGRKIVSPLDMANKFVAERGTAEAELEFVYFLRGDENSQTASQSTEEEFINSVSWSKFSFLQE